MNLQPNLVSPPSDNSPAVFTLGMSWGSSPIKSGWGDDQTDTQTKVLPEEKEKDDLSEPWDVVVFNDPVNLMSYVSMVIQRIFGYPETKAQLMMLDVHQKGSCVVWTGEKERAEHYVQQLQSHQLLSSMRKGGE